jgi:DNA-binding NarL/FixJ family response regulator
MYDVIRVLVVDDHPVVRAGLTALLGQSARICVVGEATDGLEAIGKAGELQPNVVLMDVQMPRLNGVEAIRQIKEQWPAIQILILTTYDDDELIWTGLQAGARGYLLKDAPPDELYRAVEAVARGQSLLQASIAAKLVERIARPAPGAQETLTEREIEILSRMATGAANKEIAAELLISDNTVKTHISNIFQKLGARDRTEAVTKALQRGLIQL